MTLTPEQELNQAAYNRLKHEIAQKYSKNRLVAIGSGQIVADTATFEDMLTKLAELGWNPRNCMVVRAGDTTPDYVTII